MRGVEGFGVKHHLRTDRLLTLSEDLPLVSVAVDARPRIESALADATELQFEGQVDEVTINAGPVTSEMFPAFRATGPELAHGGLRLAHLPQ